MSTDKPQRPAGLREPPDSERLDSWKRVAAYLKRDESTVRRWENEGLPVHRHAHKKKATIYAYTSEIDAWWNVGRLPGRAVAGEITSIAVLPLKNLSGDPGQDYFADGMTEALITELGKISSLRVLSYQSRDQLPADTETAAGDRAGAQSRCAAGRLRAPLWR